MSQQDDTKLGWQNSTNDWRATLRSGSLCRKVLGTCGSEIMMDLNARQWFTSMQWDEIEHQWAELQARARRHWFHLTQEDVEQITGTREQLIERVQERYGFSREQAVKEVDAWAFFLRPDL